MTTHPRKSLLWLLALLTLAAPEAQAQYNSRAEEIEAARRKKAAQLQPELASGTERFLVQVKERRILEKISYGWHGIRPRFGNLATGQGFAFGPEYFNDEIADGAVMFRAGARGSTRRAYLIDAELAFPRLAGGAMFANILAVHRNFPQMQYYGPGPNSSRGGRTDYRLEDTSADGTVGVRPALWMRMGVTAAYLKVNVGPGTRPQWANTERVFTPAQAPGIDRQTDFARGGAFAAIDYRDNAGGPRSGGLYYAQFMYNKDQDLHRHTFRRLDLEAQQYIPLFNQRRVIALRGKSSLSYANPGQVVPFYMQPTLGGSDDLRGFRPFRFHDDNMIVFNGEYRFEVFSGLDMAVFGDTGKVFHKRSQWNLHDMEEAWGFGFRFNARNNVFFRIDTGFSREGFQIWFKFNNVF